MYTNVDILSNKKLELETLLDQNKIDIALLCETLPKKQDKNAPQKEYIINGYDIIEDQVGRGVMILYKDYLQVKILDEINKIYSPSLFINISNKNSHLNLGLVYRSPNISKEDDEKLNSQLIKATKSIKNVVIFGDLNHPEINWDCMYCKCKDSHPASVFLHNILEHKIKQLVNEPTHHKPNCRPSLIDLILTKSCDSLGKIKMIQPIGKSHHSIILTSINNPVEKDLSHSCSKKYLINKGNFENMNEYLAKVDWDKAFLESGDNVDIAWNKISSHIYKTRDENIPQVKIKPTTKSKRPVPLNDSMLHLIREKRYFFKQYKKYPSQTNFHLYHMSRTKVNYYLRRERRKKEAKIASNMKRNPKQFYQYVKSKTSKRDNIPDLIDKNGVKATTDEEKSATLNDFFSSVFTNENLNEVPIKTQQLDDTQHIDTAEISIQDMALLLKKLKPDKSPGTDQIHPRILKECADNLAKPLKLLFDLTMKTGNLPAEWKQAEVRPIYKKKGKKSDPSNYRPVSLTSTVCKIMEKVVKSKLCNHIIDQNILSPHQFGFIPGRSTGSQLLITTQEWQKNLDEGIPTDVAYMDFKKAFDAVPHTRLLGKLDSYGIKGKLLMWIKNFLSDRTQHVKINGAKSSERKVTSGVPQGSVLGPMLFIYFINDLPEVTTVTTKIFADDTKAYTAIKNDQDQANLQTTIDNMYRWTVQWQLKFNETKCKILHLGDNNQKRKYYIGEGQERIELEETTLEKDLGVHIDPSLSFDSHIDKIIKKASSKTAQILDTFSYRSKHVLVPMFKTLVRPVLEYVNSVWNSHQRYNVDEIENVQKRFTKHILEVKRLDYEERLAKLKLPSLEYRRFRGDLIETYKFAHKIYDNTPVSSLFNFRGESRLRGHEYTLIKNSTRKCQYQNFFTNRVCNAWNSLPEDTVNAKSINSFKNKIDQRYKDIMFKTNLPLNLTLFS